MPIDRGATLRQAEKLLRQGKLDEAIAEYQALVDDQPRDWNTANLLGDLHLRAGHDDRAIEQFSRTAESLRKEGFLAKAAALYKKILKLRPDDDHALVRAGEVSAEQGLLADARTFLTTAAEGRRARGDLRGAADLVIRLGALDSHDVAARLSAAHARHAFDDVTGAIKELSDLSTMLIEEGRDDDALEPLRQLAALDPRNALAPRELARILIARGRTDDAAAYLTIDAIGEDTELMLLAADVRLHKGDTAIGLEMIDTVLAAAPGVADRVSAMADRLLGDHRDTAFSLFDRIVSVRIADRDWDGAVEVLRTFVGKAPGHVPALTRLVEVCVDGGLDAPLIDAQVRLVDAYVKAGAVAAAKYVAQDLVARHPDDPAHLERLRAALAASGEADPDQALADWLASLPGAGADHELEPADVVGEHADDGTEPAGVVDRTNPVRSPHGELTAAGHNPFAIDLDEILGTPQARQHVPDASAHIDTRAVVNPTGAAAPVSDPAGPGDLESVFARMRDEVVHRSTDDAAEVAYGRGVALLEAGQAAEAVDQLRLAMRAPGKRFASASQLARAYQQLGRTRDAIEWLGHAVDVPGITPAERFDTLHRLAELLEASGEATSALAVCLELQADAGDFRDLAARIARLSRAQAGG